MKDRILKKILLYVLRKLKTRIYGVQFERRLVPEFVITRHAEQRLQERIPQYEPKTVTALAWFDGQDPGHKYRYNRESNREYGTKRVYREYNNYIFVFSIRKKKSFDSDNKTYILNSQKHLITVLNKVPL